MMSSRKTVAEGYKTSKSVYQCTKLYDVDMSISTEVYRVLYEDKPLADALNTLLTRPIKPEITT
jgi:glycerol-3-phosphate dehydrogenase (NAD(P)+)